MIGAVVLLMAIVATIAALLRKRPTGGLPRTPRRSPSRSSTTVPAIPAYVEALIQRWAAADLLSIDQAERIRAFEISAIEGAPTAVRRSRMQSIAEAIGYLGGMLGIGGIIVLLAEFWDEFSDPVRSTIPGVAAVVFVCAGFLVPEERSQMMVRLRTFLWVLAIAASALTAWVFADVVLDVSSHRQQWLAVGIAIASVSGALWAGKNRPVQQFLALVGLSITICTAVGEVASTGTSGLVLWVPSTGLVAFSMRRADMRSSVFVLAGSIAVVVGAYVTVATWMGPGLMFVVFTGLALTTPTILAKVQLPSPAPLIMGIVGAVALVQAVPASLVHFAHRAGVATGLTLWGLGIVVLVLVSQHVLRLEFVVTLLAGAMLIVGSAVTGAQSIGFATLFGLTTAVALIAIGARPGSALMSVFGLIGLLVFIPWTISHYFPGEGRVPVLIIVSGLVLVGVAVGLTRVGGRLRGEIGAGSS